MKQYTIEFDDVTHKWLEHISNVTGRTIDELIADGISKLIITHEDDIHSTFLDKS